MSEGKQPPKFSLCVLCLPEKFRPTSNEDRQRHNRIKHGISNGQSNVCNVNRSGRIRKDLFRPAQTNNHLFRD